MNQKDLDAVVVGAIGIDTNVYLYGEDIDFRVESNFTQNLDYVGQAGGYSARLFASLGKKTGFLGAVGDDFFGDHIRSVLAGDGIEAWLFTDPEGTNRSINLMGKDGRRRNFYDAKRAMDIRADESSGRNLFHRSRIAHFSIQNWCRYLLKAAREEGCVVAVDLQDVVSVDDEYRRDFVEAADVIFFSAANHADPGTLVASYLARRPQALVISGMGSRGCALGTAEGIRYFSPVEWDVPVVDTNGAGDSLAVGFLASHFCDGFSLDDSLLRAQIAARHTCTVKASSSLLIKPEELERRFTGLRSWYSASGRR